MIIAEYLNHLWIQEDSDFCNSEINYLVSRNLCYIEVTEYFLKHYGIAVIYATYKSTDEGAKLQLTLKDKEIDAKTLFTISETAIFGSESSYDEVTGGEYSCSYILLDIDQSIEQL